MALGSALAAQLGMVEEVYANEVQTVTITGTPTGGTFTLTFDGATTAAIAFNAAAAAVQSALEALPNIGTGGVVCAGGPFPGTGVTVTFSGPLVSGRDVPLMTHTDSFTGGASPAAAVATTTPGTGYGDYVVPTRFLDFNTEQVNKNIQNIDSKSIRAGNRVLRGDKRVRNPKDAGGTLDFEVLSKGFGMVFKHIVGNAPVITTPTGATNARLQTFTLGDPKGLSLTIQVGRPDTNGTVRPFAYKGCKFMQWDLTLDVDGLLMLSLTVDAQAEDTAQSLAAASYAAATELLSYVAGQVTVLGANTDVTHFKLSGVVGYKNDRFFVRSNTKKKEPIPIKLYALSGEITAEFTDMALYNDFVNGTPAAITLNCQGQTVIDAGGPTYKAGVLITLPYCIFNGDTPNVGGDDVIITTFPFDALNDGVNPSLTLAYTTLDAAI